MNRKGKTLCVNLSAGNRTIIEQQLCNRIDRIGDPALIKGETRYGIGREPQELNFNWVKKKS